MSKIWEALKKAEQEREAVRGAQPSADTESAINAYVTARALAAETRRSITPARAGWLRRSKTHVQR